MNSRMLATFRGHGFEESEDHDEDVVFVFKNLG